MIRCAIVCNYANIAAAGSCHGYVWDSGAKECTVGTIDDSVTQALSELDERLRTRRRGSGAASARCSGSGCKASPAPVKLSNQKLVPLLP